MWNRLHRVPGGRWLFSRMLGRMVPYSGTIGARVLALEPGHAVLALKDRRKVRNHLASVHAIALANLGELTSGLATLTGLGAGVRGIVTRIEVEYLKKARGPLRAEARVEIPQLSAPLEHEAVAEIFDASHEIVAVVRASWRLSPPA
jgi:acyl-coenzyme A thioesterase PaaI-like protein